MAANPAYPAQTLADGSSLVIDNGNTIHNIVNGGDTEEFEVDDGFIPSVRKMQKDNFYYKDPTDWVETSAVTEFNQLVKFTDGTLWVAPTARVSNPILMGATPVGDSLWQYSPVGNYWEESELIQTATDTADATYSQLFAQTTGASQIGETDGTVQEKLDSLEENQQSGVIVFQTYALLDAYVPTVAQQSGSFKVANDPDSSKNGYYAWVSGTTYTKDADLVINVIDENNTSDPVSGAGVFDFTNPLNTNERIYDIKNRIRFVDGEINDPQYAPNLSPRPALDFSIVSNELVLLGTGASSNPSVFWLGHVRKLSKNTEIIMRLTLDASYAGGSSAGPGPMVYFGDSALRGFLYAESGTIFGFDGNRSGQGTYGQSPTDPLAAFDVDDEVEMRIVLRDDGTGFVIGKKLSTGYELRLDLDESNLASFGEGKIWVAYNRDTPETISHFEVNELEIIPEDFNQEEVLDDIASLQQSVAILEQTAGEKTVKYAMPTGFAMYQPVGFDILRGLTSKSFYTTFDKSNYLLSTSSNIYVDPTTGNDGNAGDLANPLLTMAQAVTNANAGAVPATIYLNAGEYAYHPALAMPAFTVDVNIIGLDSVNRPEVTTTSVEAGWVLDGVFTNLYKVTVADDAPVHCYDHATLDEYGKPKGLILRTQGDADTTPGSYFISGNEIFVRTYDDRLPDLDFRVVRDTPLLDFSNQLFYVENAIFRGGNNYTAVAPDNVAGTCCTVNSSFGYGIGQGFRWIRSSGTSKIIHYQSECMWSAENDGFSYTSAGSGTDAIEIECFGHHNGIEKGSTHNGSTIHTATRMIRVNCDHSYNWNKNVADVSANTQSLNLGVLAGTTGDTGVTKSINFNAETGSTVWYDSCVSNGGSDVDFSVGVGSIMNVRNTDLYLKNNITDGTFNGF